MTAASPPRRPLDLPRVLTLLGAGTDAWHIEWVAACESTNSVLLERAARGAAHRSVLVAERQSGGRGRMGRAWQDAEEGALALSVLWRLPPGRAPAGLSLAVGLAVARAAIRVGAPGMALKWPNDVLRGAGKLAGILCELTGGTAVLGIGLNLRLAEASPLRALGAADLTGVVPAPTREDVLAAVLNELDVVLPQFDRAGFAPLRESWQALDAYAGRQVRAQLPGGDVLYGVCAGVDEDGALLIDDGAGARRVLAGDVSLRAA